MIHDNVRSGHEEEEHHLTHGSIVQLVPKASPRMKELTRELMHSRGPSLILKVKSAKGTFCLYLGDEYDARSKEILIPRNIYSIINCAREVKNHHLEGDALSKALQELGTSSKATMTLYSPVTSAEERQFVYMPLLWEDNAFRHKRGNNEHGWKIFLQQVHEAHDFIFESLVLTTLKHPPAVSTTTTTAAETIQEVKKEVTAAHNSCSVLIHCAVGVNRSATLTISFVMRALSFNFYDAFAYVHKARPIIHPAVIYCQYLIKFQSYLFFSNSTYAKEAFKNKTSQEVTTISPEKQKEIDTEYFTNLMASCMCIAYEPMKKPQIKDILLKHWSPFAPLPAGQETSTSTTTSSNTTSHTQSSPRLPTIAELDLIFTDLTAHHKY